MCTVVVEARKKMLRNTQQIFKMIKAEDPETAVTEYLIRKLIYEGQVPTVECGNKKMACYEDVCAYLYEGRRWNR